MRFQPKILLLCFLCSASCFSQKYNFVNWTVEDGLIQSQASCITQDKYRQLWIGTEGGISKFDGRKFTGYAVQEGLVANHVNCLLSDKAGNIWIGTNYGISIFNGNNFKTLNLSASAANRVSVMVELGNETIYALNNSKVFRINNSTGEEILVTGDKSEKVISLYKTSTDHLLAFVIGKGIFKYEENKWHRIAVRDETWEGKYVREFFISTSGDTLLAHNTGVCRLKNGRSEQCHTDKKTKVDLNVLSIAEDEKKNIWLGTDIGVYRLEGTDLLHFDGKSGFTDNSVNQIYRDVENNLWFATDADGIFKFRENTFTYYDKSSGLANPIVMGVVQDGQGTIYAAGYGGGLYKINTKKEVEAMNVLSDSRINSLYADDENNIWIGAIGRGAWKYNEKGGYKRISGAKDEPQIRSATCFLKDQQGNMLIGSSQGLFLLDKKENLNKIISGNLAITALRQWNADSVIIGTSKGVYVMNNKFEALPLSDTILANSSVLCITKDRDKIWIGTIDQGVLCWHWKTRKIIQYKTSDGLPSNFIYSIDVSDKKLWVGTGFGISNLQLSDEGKILGIKNYGRSDGLLGMECSHNCLLRDKDSSLWFGTTKGLFHFNPYTATAEKNKPLVLLKSVKLFSADISDSTLYQRAGTWFKVPEGLRLSSKQNHITFELGAIYFTNPEDLLYKYKLVGIDKNFNTSSNPFIIYPALPPGKYTLNVKSVTKSGLSSSNEINYTFVIEKAFYQTRWFQVLVVFLLVASGALLTYVLTRGRQKRKQKAKELLEKIREEEFMKLRQRTAEDFHDEMGNSLTRISVLTDVLKSKINGKEAEVTKLVQQIKENTNTLYSGSRDIIWSLNSRNDGLFEITEHIKDIGNELFHDTAIDFQYHHNVRSDTTLKLKLDYSRNLTMIFKEAFSNILKHSKADKVRVQISLKNGSELEILLNDNGKGFDKEKASNGNGLKNMKNRVERMGGQISVFSDEQAGTEINIHYNKIFI